MTLFYINTSVIFLNFTEFMADKEQMGDFLRNIIEIISENLANLEKEKVKYGKFRQYVTGINKNIEKRQKDLDYYVNLYVEYKKDGLAE